MNVTLLQTTVPRVPCSIRETPTRRLLDGPNLLVMVWILLPNAALLLSPLTPDTLSTGKVVAFRVPVMPHALGPSIAKLIALGVAFLFVRLVLHIARPGNVTPSVRARENMTELLPVCFATATRGHRIRRAPSAPCRVKVQRIHFRRLVD